LVASVRIVPDGGDEVAGGAADRKVDPTDVIRVEGRLPGGAAIDGIWGKRIVKMDNVCVEGVGGMCERGRAVCK